MEIIYLVSVEGDDKNRYLNEEEIRGYINGDEMLKMFDNHGD